MPIVESFREAQEPWAAKQKEGSSGWDQEKQSHQGLFCCADEAFQLTPTGVISGPGVLPSIPPSLGKILPTHRKAETADNRASTCICYLLM